MWVDGRNLNDIEEVAAVLTEAGLDAAQVRQPHPGPGRQGPAEGDDATKRWRAACSAPPRCFVDDMMFFGNDRLPFVEMALKGELK